MESHDFGLLANRGITGGRTRAVEIKVVGLSDKQIRRRASGVPLSAVGGGCGRRRGRR
jgi:hypothetical protein